MNNIIQKEDKELLLKDLSARVPYGVKFKFKYSESLSETIKGISVFNDIIICSKDESCLIDDVKPYLFPLSSMTEEQKKEYNRLRDFVPTYHYEYGDIVEDTELYDNFTSISYLIANHFDINGLIPMGLALDATGKNIY